MYEIKIQNSKAFRGAKIGHGPDNDVDLGPYRLVSEIVEHLTGPDLYVDGRFVYLRDGHPDDDGESVAAIIEVQ